MYKNDYLSVIRILQKSENLIVYGLGEAGENFERVCLHYGISVNAYVDSNREGQFYGHKISRLEELKDMKNSEIALMMNVSVRTVEAHIYKALKTLRSRLGTVFLFFLFFLDN